jgi:L-lactate dehydrogenase complex protein LldG
MAQSACCTFITGPSRTADIELSLTIGVHGPGRLVVVVGP